MKNCTNCHVTFKGKYCPSCGQNSEISEINFKEISSYALGEIFSFDSRLFKSLKMSLLESGSLSKAYVTGKRRSYMNPISYYFISLSLIILTMNFFPYDYFKFSQDSIGTFARNAKQFPALYKEMTDSVRTNFGIEIEENTDIDSLIITTEQDTVLNQLMRKIKRIKKASFVQEEMPHLIIDNYRLFNFLIFLPLPLILRIFLSKKKYPQTMAQIYVMALFNASHINLIMVPFHIINHFLMDFRVLFIPQVIATLYTINTCRHFFETKQFSKSVIFGFSYLIMYMIFIFLVSLGTFLYIMMNF